MAITPAKKADKTIYVLNGPNLDPSGTGEAGKNGPAELANVERVCADTARHFGLQTRCKQASREADLIDFIHEAQANNAAGIVINAGGYSPTSTALQDALERSKLPSVEVRISNIQARKNFRHQSFTAKSAIATLTGFGIDGYRLAINGLAARIGAAKIGVTAKA